MAKTQYHRIVSAISKLEGKKKQVSVGNIREVLACLVKLEAAARVEAALESAEFSPPYPNAFPLEQLERQINEIVRKELRQRVKGLLKK